MSAIVFQPLTSGNQMAPYRRTNDADRHGRHGVTDPDETLRLQRYEEFWNFYLGQQWTVSRENGEPLITANYCGPSVDKKATWVIGKGMVITVPGAFAHVTKPILESVWRDNDRDAILPEIATLGGITGDSYVFLSGRPPTADELALNPNVMPRITVRVVTPERVILDLDPRDRTVIRRARITTEVPFDGDEARPDLNLDTRGNLFNRRTPTEPTPPPVRTRRWIEEITAESFSEGWEGGQMLSKRNDLKEIPLVHIPNLRVPGEFYGRSDLDGAIDLQREFNEKMTDVSDIVHFHAAPITIITGAKAVSLDKSPKNLWSIPDKDAKVFNLTLGSDLGASHKYLELVRQIFFDITGLPEGSLGRMQSISNTSAAALESQFQPLIEVTRRKQANYSAGLQRVNYFILRIYQLLQKTMFPVDMCAHCGGRVLRFRQVASDGRVVEKKRCYLADPFTLDFMKPDDVKVNVVIEHSFGNETRMMRYGLVKKIWGKKAPSFWDPSPMVEKEQEAIVKKVFADAQQELLTAEQEEKDAVAALGEAEAQPDEDPTAGTPAATPTDA